MIENLGHDSALDCADYHNYNLVRLEVHGVELCNADWPRDFAQRFGILFGSTFYVFREFSRERVIRPVIDDNTVRFSTCMPEHPCDQGAEQNVPNHVRSPGL